MEVSDLGVVYKLSFHAGLIFNMGLLVDTLGEVLGGRSKASLSVSLPENVLTLNTLDVSTVAWDLLPRVLLLLDVGLLDVEELWPVPSVARNGILIVWDEHIF